MMNFRVSCFLLVLLVCHWQGSEARLLSGGTTLQQQPLERDSSSSRHRQEQHQPRHALSRVDQLSQELHIDHADPNQDILTNVALNLEWGI